MLHYKAYSSDGINGVSILSRAKMTIESGLAAQKYQGKFYEQNAQPSGVLTVDTEPKKEAKEKVREQWDKMHSGVDNPFRTAVLDLGMKYQPISISNKDAQFVESHEVTVIDIARFFGVPPYKLYAGKQSYNSNEQNSIEYVTSTIHPIVEQCDEEDTYKLLFDSEIRAGMSIRRNMMAEPERRYDITRKLVQGHAGSRRVFAGRYLRLGRYAARRGRRYQVRKP